MQCRPGRKRGDVSSPQPSTSWPCASIHFKGLASSPSLLVGNDQLNSLKSIRYKGNCYVCVWGSAEGQAAETCLYLGRGIKSGSLVLPLVASLSSIEILTMLHNLLACQFLP